MTDDHSGHVAASTQIHNLLARLAHLTDFGDLDDYLALLTDDAVWQMPPNPRVGLPANRRVGKHEIADGVRERRESGLQGPGTATLHVVTSIEVLAITDDTAGSVAYFMFYQHTHSRPELTLVGRYDDRFRASTDGWRLCERTITLG